MSAGQGNVSKSFHVLSHEDLEAVGGQHQEFALAVLLGLSKTEKSLPSRYFYDDEGSRLFQQIMALEEYYPTDCERRIFLKHRQKLADRLTGESFNLIDLGSGDGSKTNLLIETFLERGLEFTYIPIDISEAAVREQLKDLEKRFPSLRVEAIVAEYFNGLLWHTQRSDRRNVLLFLGSNLGNFHRSEARAFLRSIWNSLRHNDLALIGFDLKKPIGRMMRAYNDSQGVTSRFNLNLLRRINRELGGEFDLDQFQHHATYNVFSGAMESYLISLKEQQVMIKALNQCFHFDPYEPIHTEYSYKFLPSDIEGLAENTGFEIMDELFDDQRDFVDSLWQVKKALPT